MNLNLTLILIFLCCLSSTLELITRKQLKNFCFILAAIFLYIIASRNIYTVPDTLAYVTAYERINPNGSLYDLPFEPGYVFLNLIAKKTGLSYKFFLAIIALIQCSVYMYAMRKIITGSGIQKFTFFPCVCFSIWVGFWGLFYSGIVLRAGVAISFAFLAHAFIAEKKFFKAALSFLLAYTFHYSIVIYPLFFCASKLIRITKYKNYVRYAKAMAFIWVITYSRYTFVAVHYLVANILRIIALNFSYLRKYAIYTENIYDSSDSKKNLMFLAMMIIFIWTYPRNNTYYNSWLKFFMLNLGLTFLLSSFVTGYRISDICLISGLPLCSYCFINSRLTLGSRVCTCVLFIISLFIFSLRVTGVS